ncbi:hypothetical protein TNCT_736822 [Trichonephila clavata]|uniref:Uncharacterized protein n=1 Tax=Trichonephila clavata TaxID=2740835 RepID=A0A8X6FUT1_TRICU|nr:hypothetical protein TNCT_736822 [Trichonephila clavata]
MDLHACDNCRDSFLELKTTFRICCLKFKLLVLNHCLIIEGIIPQREMEFLPFVVNCSTRNSILKQSGTMPIFFVFFLQKKSHVHK